MANNKLLVDARMLKYSGIGVYLESILLLLKKKMEITCLIHSTDESFFLNKEIPAIRFDEKIYSAREQLKYIKLIKGVDCFWSPHYNVPILPISAKRRIVTIHDVYHLAHSKELNLKQKLYAKLMMHQAISKSDSVITVSEFSKEEIIKFTGCRPEKIQVIHNGINQYPKYQDLLIIQKKYNLPDKYLLFVGNVKPHKNLKVLCLAFLKLPKHIQDESSIVIVGKKDGFINGDSELISLIQHNEFLNNKIIFTGYVDSDDMDTIYRHAIGFIFPSLYEGFGLPPLEAMVNGTPVISSSAASLPEVCGDAALFFQAESPDSLVKQILNLNDKSLMNLMIKRGYEQVRKFTWNKSVQSHLEILSQ